MSHVSEASKGRRLLPEARSRKEILLSRIDVATQVGLEIGPLRNPTVARSESPGRIFYADWAPEEEPRAAHRNDPGTIDTIVETDFVWAPGRLAERVGSRRFDYVIASHVIERVPNLLGWLRELASVLRDDGILSLAIADKRYCADLYRELTTIGTLVESYLLDRRRPSVRDIFEHVALTSCDSPVNTSKPSSNAPKHQLLLETAWSKAVEYQASGAYEDTHVTIVTPESFLHLLEWANRLGLLDFTVVDLVDTGRQDPEFFVAMKRTPRDLERGQATALQAAGFAHARARLPKKGRARDTVDTSLDWQPPAAWARRQGRFLRKLRKAWAFLRPPVRPRKELLLHEIDVASQVGLEIGPLSHPIVTKAESRGGVSYVDFATAEQLRAKYRDDTYVKVDDIVDVDFVWGRQTLPELVNGRLFDYVIASHVIEHVPNMIGWLREVAAVLRDNGILSLAIPDKRYTFDIKRSLTGIGTLIEAYLSDRRRPGIREVFEHAAFTVHVDPVKAWSCELRKLSHHNPPEIAWANTLEFLNSDEYVDAHVTIVTPERFLDILDAMNRLELLDFAIDNFVGTRRETLEFFVTLRRTPRALERSEALERQRKSIEDARSHLTGAAR
jgi:predicted SAM-dependent methyltransferase